MWLNINKIKLPTAICAGPIDTHPWAVLSPVSNPQVNGWCNPVCIAVQCPSGRVIQSFHAIVSLPATFSSGVRTVCRAPRAGTRIQGHLDGERLFGAGSEYRAVVLLCAASPEVVSSWDPAMHCPVWCLPQITSIPHPSVLCKLRAFHWQCLVAGTPVPHGREQLMTLFCPFALHPPRTRTLASRPCGKSMSTLLQR